MGYIDSILGRIKEMGLSHKEVADRIHMHPQIITDLHNKKRKQLSVEQLEQFSNALEFDFFQEVQAKLLINRDKRKKKVRVTVQIEVDDLSKERTILDQVLESKQVVKKLLGE